MSLMMIKLIAANILHNFEVHTANTWEQVFQNISTCVWPSKDLGVRWKKRVQSNAGFPKQSYNQNNNTEKHEPI